MTKRAKQAGLLGVLAILFLLLVLRAKPASPPGGGPAAPPPASATAEVETGRSFGRGPQVKAVSPDAVPDIDVSAFSRRPEGSSDVTRDLFKFNEPPPPPPP